MVVGTFTRGCQTVVIGGGPGGYTAAIRLAQLNRDVILVEKDSSLGGACLNRGCIPSKALIHATDWALEARQAHRMGIEVGDIRVDLPRLVKWKDSIVSKLTGGVRFLCEKNGVDIITGTASFSSDRTIGIDTREGPVTVEFEDAIIATGSSPLELPGFPVDNHLVIGSREALSLEEIPQRLLVIGGGYIGLELGSVFRKLGSNVTIVESLPDPVPSQDKEVIEVLKQRLQELEIKLYLQHRAETLEPGAPARVHLRGPDGEMIPVATDKILVSIGSSPNSHGLGLKEIGVTLDEKGYIKVDPSMRTSVPGIYAIGDVIGGPLLAHKAYREAKVAAEVIAGEPSAFDNVVIPAVVYTDPEISWAGLSEKEAREKGFEVVTGTFPFRASGRALTLNATQGFVKTVADASTKRILGVTIVGNGASEMISEAVLAIEMGAFLDDLAQTIHPHPTLSESLLESVESALGHAIHMATS